MTRLDQAIKLAVEVHSGQVDKGDNPYILHPLRVMLAAEKDLRSGSGKYREDYLCAAVCHDVAEDYNRKDFSWFYINEKLHELGDRVYIAINHLTRREGQSWKDYLTTLYKDEMARFIKILDLEDNCDLTRIQKTSNYKADTQRIEKYIRARNYLETGTGNL